jgi:hypothetical protein
MERKVNAKIAPTGGEPAAPSAGRLGSYGDPLRGTLRDAGVIKSTSPLVAIQREALRILIAPPSVTASGSATESIPRFEAGWE